MVSFDILVNGEKLFHLNHSGIIDIEKLWDDVDKNIRNLLKNGKFKKGTLKEAIENNTFQEQVFSIRN